MLISYVRITRKWLSILAAGPRPLLIRVRAGERLEFTVSVTPWPGCARCIPFVLRLSLDLIDVIVFTQ